MRQMKPILALLGLCIALPALTGCGGGGSSHTAQPITTPVVSPTFPTSNQGPGVQPGASGSSGQGSTGTTTNGSTNTPVSVASIVLSPTTATLEANRRMIFTALGKDATGNPVNVPDANWKWTSSNPAVALLTNSGSQATVSAVAAGTTTITVLEGASGTTAQVNLTVTAASGGSGSGGTGTIQFYGNDFENGAGSEWSKRTVSTTPGTAAYPATKFLGMFANEVTTLALANLPAHSSVTLEFDFFCILTWDGNNTVAGVGPSLFNVSVEGGPTLLNASFANITPQLGFPASTFQSYPDPYPGGVNLYQSGASAIGTLGYTYQGNPSDSVYHFKFTFPHTSGAINIDFGGKVAEAATTKGPDDFWGLKNVQVTLNP